MTAELTYIELAALMKNGAGLTVDANDLRTRPDAAFAEFGLDSLGLLGMVGRLEDQFAQALPAEADKCNSPREFLQLVNATLTTGA
ncbi:acyl carrier protein [Streptomyces odontomachi]|uniref:acyl carrier protein n=1 Tax=Streptomyces odontomachi TaxID=2944940 RepID=UPI00210ECCD5|nr:acyl carrier protein [Streptomyces sp. ODS25]